MPSVTPQVKELRSYTAGKSPALSEIAEGQLFLNITDRFIAGRDNANNIVMLGNMSKPIYGYFERTEVEVTFGSLTTVQTHYKKNYTNVYLNGKRLLSTQYTASDNVQVTIPTAVSGDKLLLEIFDEDSGMTVSEFPSGGSTFTVSGGFDACMVFVGGLATADYTVGGGNTVSLTAPTALSVAIVAFNATAPFVGTYDKTKSYSVGDKVVYIGAKYTCTAATTGTFNAAKWSITP